MTDLRTAAAAVLGVALGAVLITYPDAVIRAHTAGRLPGDRGGGYGEDAPAPARWRRLVRVVGVALLVIGGYFGRVALG